MKNCKVCGSIPEVVKDTGKCGKVDHGVRCVKDDHYIHVIGDTPEQALNVWELLMGATVN